jgi:hypothetical protein
MACGFMARAWVVPGISASAKVVLLKLADLAGDDGRVTYRPFAELAALCVLDVATIERALFDLAVEGLVSVTRDGCYLLPLAAKAGVDGFVEGSKKAGVDGFVEGSKKAGVDGFVEGSKKAGVDGFVEGSKKAGVDGFVEGSKKVGDGR